MKIRYFVLHYRPRTSLKYDLKSEADALAHKLNLVLTKIIANIKLHSK